MFHVPLSTPSPNRNLYLGVFCKWTFPAELLSVDMLGSCSPIPVLKKGFGCEEYRIPAQLVLLRQKVETLNIHTP